VYCVKEGWEPLCKFLGKDIPEEPFPKKNIDGKAYVPEKYMRQFERQALKEALIAFFVFTALLIALYFSINSYNCWQTFSICVFGVLTWYFLL